MCRILVSFTHKQFLTTHISLVYLPYESALCLNWSEAKIRTHCCMVVRI